MLYRIHFDSLYFCRPWPFHISQPRTIKVLINTILHRFNTLLDNSRTKYTVRHKGGFFFAPATSFCSGLYFVNVFIPVFTLRGPNDLRLFPQPSRGKFKKKMFAHPHNTHFLPFSLFGGLFLLTRGPRPPQSYPQEMSLRSRGRVKVIFDWGSKLISFIFHQWKFLSSQKCIVESQPNINHNENQTIVTIYNLVIRARTKLG